MTLYLARAKRTGLRVGVSSIPLLDRYVAREVTAVEHSIDPQQIQTLWLEPHDLSLAERHRTIRSLRKRRQNPLTYEVAFWRRVSAPVYMGVMVMLAVPMVLVGGRSVRLGERATLGALVGIGFQMFQEMFTNLGLVSGFPPLLIALGPALVGLVSVSALFRWQGLR